MAKISARQRLMSKDSPGNIFDAQARTAREQVDIAGRNVEASDLAAVAQNAIGGVDLSDGAGLTILAPESFDIEVRFKTEDEYVISELDAGWVSSSLSGLGIYGIGKTSAEKGYLALVAYNDDKSKNANLQLTSDGIITEHLDTGSNVGNNTQYHQLLASSNQTAIVQTPFRLVQRTSGTAADGFGIGQSYFVENASGNDAEAGAIRFVLRRLVDTTEVGVPKLGVIQGGTVIDFDPYRGSIPGSVKFASSSSEETVLSQTIKRYSMGTKGVIWTRLFLLFANNSGGAAQTTLKYKLDSYSSTFRVVAAANSAVNRSHLWVDIITFNDAAANAQIHIYRVTEGTNDATATFGVLDADNGAWDSSAIDLDSGDKTLSITQQMSVSNAAAIVRATAFTVGPIYGA